MIWSQRPFTEDRYNALSKWAVNADAALNMNGLFTEDFIMQCDRQWYGLLIRQWNVAIAERKKCQYSWRPVRQYELANDWADLAQEIPLAATSPA